MSNDNKNNDALMTTIVAAIMLSFIFFVANMQVDLSFASKAGDPNRHIPDYIAFWPAGYLVWEGKYSLVYNMHSIFEVQGMIYSGFDSIISYVHPPFFLFIMTPLAYFSFKTSMMIWLAVTAFFYVFVCWRIFPNRFALYLSVFFPSFILSVWMGQTGAACAALLGGAFLSIEHNKIWMAGLCLALLAFKPQLGVLIPLALLAGREWKVFFAAFCWGAALFVSSVIVFDVSLWFSWLDAIRYTTNLYFGAPTYHILHFQSLFGVLQFLEMPQMIRWIAQIIWGMLMAGLVSYVWWNKQRFSFEARIAVLVTGTLMATPYVMMYDYAVLVIPMLFLSRRYFDRTNLLTRTNLLFGLSLLCTTMILAFRLPAGFFASLALLSIVFLPENRKIEKQTGM